MPRVHADLAEAGHHVSRKRVARLMRARPPRGRPPPPVRAHDDPRRGTRRPFPDLVDRDFTAPGPDRLWVADITAAPDAGGLLLPRLDRRRLEPPGRRLEHGDPHADRARHARPSTRRSSAAVRARISSTTPTTARQYTSLAFGRRLRESGIAASMGSVGDCYDNAMAESFFATLETELIDRSDWASPAEAKAAVFEYIEVFYNRIRRHSSLGNLSPEQFEERYRSSPAVAAGEASPSTKPGQLHPGREEAGQEGRLPRSDRWSRHSDLNRGPAVYEIRGSTVSTFFLHSTGSRRAEIKLHAQLSVPRWPVRADVVRKSVGAELTLERPLWQISMVAGGVGGRRSETKSTDDDPGVARTRATPAARPPVGPKPAVSRRSLAGPLARGIR